MVRSSCSVVSSADIVVRRRSVHMRRDEAKITSVDRRFPRSLHPEQKTEVTLSLLHPFFTNLGLRWLGDCMSLATRCLNVSQRRLAVAASRPRWQWRRSNSSGVEVPPHLGLPTSHAEENPDISHPAQSIRIKPYYITTPIFYPNSGLSI